MTREEGKVKVSQSFFYNGELLLNCYSFNLTSKTISFLNRKDALTLLQNARICPRQRNGEDRYSLCEIFFHFPLD